VERPKKETVERLRFGAKQAVEVCARIKADEKVVLLKDRASAKAASYLEEEITKVGAELRTIQVESFGERPRKVPPETIRLISNSDVAFICCRYVAEEYPTLWKPIGKLVSKSRVRVASLPDLDERILLEGMNVDYLKIRDFSRKVYEAVRGAKSIRVKTGLGTDFTVELDYKWVVLDGFLKPGKVVNLPDGEILTAPKDVNGRIIIDGLIEEFDKPRFGLLKDYPISVVLKDGYAVRDSIECRNADLKAFLESNIFTQDPNACRVGEFAFGTNIYLKQLIGNFTQDEKFPSVHIAFGDPYSYMTGAPWKSKIHMDAIILEPTVWVDGKVIMKEGKYLIEP